MSVLVTYLGPVRHRRILTVANQRDLGAESSDDLQELVWENPGHREILLPSVSVGVLKYFEMSESFEVRYLDDQDSLDLEGSEPDEDEDLPGLSEDSQDQTEPTESTESPKPSPAG